MHTWTKSDWADYVADVAWKADNIQRMRTDNWGCATIQDCQFLQLIHTFAEAAEEIKRDVNAGEYVQFLWKSRCPSRECFKMIIGYLPCSAAAREDVVNCLGNREGDSKLLW